MSFTRLATPAELRLVVLLFLLGAIGFLARTAGHLSPEVERWLRDEVAPARSDTTAAPPEPSSEDGDPLSTGRDREQRGPAPAPGVDPSTAGPAELLTLPGVGPVLAARIIEDRTRNGPFRTPEDLLRVKGIGKATLERIRGDLVFPGR